MRFARLRPGSLALLLALCLGASHGQETQAGRYYEDALKRYEAKDYDGSIVQLKNALQADRNLLPAHLLLGRASLDGGNPLAAEVAFGEALRLGASRSEVAPQLAQAMLQLGRHGALLGDARLSPTGLSGNALFRLLLVRSAAQGDAGDLNNALNSIEQARAVDAESPDAWLAEVSLRIRQGQLDAARKAMSRALQLAPNSAEVHNQHGALAHVAGQPVLARQHYDTALRLDPQHRDARLARAALALDLNDIPALRLDMKELQARHKGNPRVAYLRAQLADREGDRAGAQAALREVTALIDPIPIDVIRFRPQLLMLAGLAHHALNEQEKAKPYLEMVSRQQPGSPTAKLLAQILFEEGQVENGIQLLETYLRQQPRDGQALALIASGHTTQGRHAKATAIMQEALRNQDNADLRGVLGLSLLRSGQYAGAQSELEAVYRRNPKLEQPAFSLAMLYLRTGQARKAVDIAQNLAKQRPGHASYLHLLGLAQSAAGQLGPARAAYEQALRADPTLTAAQLSLARLDARQGKWDLAEKRLLGLNGAQSGSVEVLLELSALMQQRGRLQEAERWLENAVAAAGPKELRADIAMVGLRLRRGNTAGAVEASKALIAKAPEELPALMAHARAQIANGDTSAARSTLVSASRRAGFEAAPLIEIGTLQLRLGDLNNARHSLEKSQQGNAPSAQVMGLLATVSLRQGQMADAQALADKVLQAQPRAATSHLLQADLAVARQQADKALAHLRRAHEVEPSTATLMRLFLQLSRDGKEAAALQLAESWLRQRPNDVTVLRAQADLLGGERQWQSARNAYEKLLKLQGPEPSVLNNLANVLLQSGDVPRAVQIAEQAVKLSPGQVATIDTLAWALHRAGQNERALTLLRDARTRAPELAEIRYHLAAVLAQLGRRAEAKAELQAALASPATLLSVTEARALAATLN
jgi:putative PEP-CTERM system TPR-repeat lipoprotein